MILLNFIKESLSELSNTELLLLLCLLLNFSNILLIKHWGKFKKNTILVILASAIYFTAILLSIYVIYLGFTFIK